MLLSWSRQCFLHKITYVQESCRPHCYIDWRGTRRLDAGIKTRLLLHIALIALAGFWADVATPGARALAPIRLCGESQICALSAPEDLVREVDAGYWISSAAH
jgi:hypothetical protein